jgi:trans-aconitate methyltransferase
MSNRIDGFYVKEDHCSEPKEYFKEALKIINENCKNDAISMLDIGCAAGDFLKLCSLSHANWNFSGIDVYDDNLTEAKKRVASANFYNLNINDKDFSHKNKYDLVTMLGTHGLFDEKYWIHNLVSLMKPGAFALIFGIVNPFAYDVFVKLRDCKSGNNERGWNSWSYQTINQELTSLACNSNIDYWDLPIELEFRKEDPIRSWTMNLSDGQKIVTNASRIIHDFAFIKVVKCDTKF